MSNPPISSEELQQKLQAGKINEALALILNHANELNVTTRITDGTQAGVSEASTVAQFSTSEYLSTKINLLTGEIQNEVGKDLIVNSISYIKLQQLHIDRIVASHRILQGFLQQIQGILTAIESTPTSPSPQPRSVGEPKPINEAISDGFNLSESLPTRLTAAFRAILTSTPVNSTENPSPVGDRVETPPLDRRHQQSIDPQQIIVVEPPTHKTIDRPLTAPLLSQPIVSPAAFDDDLDLSLDEHAVEWEEWVEDEAEVSICAIEPSPPIAPDEAEVSICAIEPSPPIAPTVNIPDWGEEWDRRQIEPITVKPTIPRTSVISASLDPAVHWDKFSPEHVGIYVDPQSHPHNNDDPHQIDRLLADLDRINQGKESPH